ncbi:MAG: hypothetical protein V4534_08530 [Myxococcota bacterium]
MTRILKVFSLFLLVLCIGSAEAKACGQISVTYGAGIGQACSIYPNMGATCAQGLTCVVQPYTTFGVCHPYNGSYAIPAGGGYGPGYNRGYGYGFGGGFRGGFGGRHGWRR